MVKVRPATEADIPRILALYRQLAFAPDTEIIEPSPEECRRAFGEMNALPGYHLLVAEDSEVIGTVVLALLPGLTHHASPFAVIEYVVVDEKCRGRGVGRTLMEHAVGLARKVGCYKVMLTSDNRRTEAHRFYQSLGFEDSAAGFRFYF